MNVKSRSSPKFSANSFINNLGEELHSEFLACSIAKIFWRVKCQVVRNELLEDLLKCEYAEIAELQCGKVNMRTKLSQ